MIDTLSMFCVLGDPAMMFLLASKSNGCRSMAIDFSTFLTLTKGRILFACQQTVSVLLSMGEIINEAVFNFGCHVYVGKQKRGDFFAALKTPAKGCLFAFLVFLVFTTLLFAPISL